MWLNFRNSATICHNPGRNCHDVYRHHSAMNRTMNKLKAALVADILNAQTRSSMYFTYIKIAFIFTGGFIHNRSTFSAVFSSRDRHFHGVYRRRSLLGMKRIIINEIIFLHFIFKNICFWIRYSLSSTVL